MPASVRAHSRQFELPNAVLLVLLLREAIAPVLTCSSHAANYRNHFITSCTHFFLSGSKGYGGMNVIYFHDVGRTARGELVDLLVFWLSDISGSKPEYLHVQHVEHTMVALA